MCVQAQGRPMPNVFNGANLVEQLIWTGVKLGEAGTGYGALEMQRESSVTLCYS
jgi:hypothetical protein